MASPSVLSVLIARVASAALLVIAATTLVGWHFGISALLSIPVNTTALRYNAAVAFACLALATQAICSGRMRWAQGLAVAATLIGAATALQYALNADFGIDDLVFAAPVVGPRMSPNAAFGIALAGAALSLFVVSQLPLVLTTMAGAGAIVFAIGVTAAFGYLVGFPATYTWAAVTPLSPPGAIGLCLSGITVVSLAWAASTTQRAGAPGWLPLPATLAVTTTGVIAWQAIITVQHRQPTEVAQLADWLPTAVLLGILVLALAIGVLTHSVIGEAQQTRRLETEIRTRESAEQESRRQELLLRTVLDVLPVGVFIADAHGHIHTSNAIGRAIWAGVRHVGIDSYGEYKAWWPGTQRQLRGEEWALARAVRLGETVAEQVVDIESFDGTRKTIANSAVPLYEGDAVVGGVVVVQDVTVRIQTDRALAERTADLERSNADLERFAYIASHDLQEPLRMVASFTQLLQRRYRSTIDETADEYIGFVVDGAQRMQRLLNDLLEYSRVGTRARTLLPMSAGDAARDALANLRLAIRDCGGTVTLDSLPRVIADHAQLTQVFQNLVANALTFADPQRPPHVHISGAVHGELADITVEDNGLGIECRHTEQIFKIFQRLDRSGKYPGTGLGLAICKRIVTRHGGSIGVTSTPGTGSRFTFTLRTEEVQHGPLEHIA